MSVLKTALMMIVIFTLITGVLYPLAVTGLSQVAFPWRANGSTLEKDGKAVGSDLIGQSFSNPKYFWGRPSATTPTMYNAASSTGSNLGPTNPALLDSIKARVTALKAADPGNSRPIPVDLVTASASGLDPDITVAAAIYQAPRVARVRGLREADVLALVNRAVRSRDLGFLGEPRVNVLKLNLALDDVSQSMKGGK